MRTKRLAFVLFLISIVSTTVCRFYQSGNPSEDVSLFFSSEFFCFVISLVCYIFMGLLVKVSYREQEVVDEGFRIEKNYFAAFFSVILGVVVTINGVMVLMKYINGFRTMSPLFEGFFAILAGPVFLLTSAGYVIGRDFFKNNELLALAPVAWGASRTINIFLSYNMVSNVAWNLSDVLAVIFISLFLLNQAKCIAQRDEPKKCARMRLYGYAAVMFAVVYTTKGILAGDLSFLRLPPESTGVINVISSIWVIDVVAALYILSVILGLDLKPNKTQ